MFATIPIQNEVETSHFHNKTRPVDDDDDVMQNMTPHGLVINTRIFLYAKFHRKSHIFLPIRTSFTWNLH